MERFCIEIEICLLDDAMDFTNMMLYVNYEKIITLVGIENACEQLLLITQLILKNRIR